MKSFLKQFLLISLFSSVLIVPSIGQSFSPYFTESQYVKYIEYLINNGTLKIPHPLSQPYTVDKIYDNLSKAEQTFNSPLLKMLRKDLLKMHSPIDSVNKFGKIYGEAEGGIRLNFLENCWDNKFYGDLLGGYSYQNFGMFYRHSFDQAYPDDTAYFKGEGKITNKIYGRTSEAYAQWNLKNLSFFIGRLNRNYGMMNEPSLILSENPYSYDHISIKFENRLLKYTFLLTRLNDIYGFDIRDTVPVYTWNNRFLSMHRFEIAILKNLELAFTESILFGGENEGIQFQYINPVAIFFFSKMSDRSGNENQDANAFMSFEVFFKPIKKITFFTQFLIDDLDVKSDLSAEFPTRLGISAKLVFSDPFPGSQVYLKYNRISNWTYNSFYTWGNYISFDKSLGYPKNGVENLSAGMDCFRFAPFILGLELKAERERAQDLQGPFIAEKTKFPVGISQNSFSSSLNVTYFPKTWIFANLSTQFIAYENFQHIEGKSQSFFNIYLTIKIIGIFKFFEKGGR